MVPPDIAEALHAAAGERERSDVQWRRLVVEAVEAGGSLREVAELAGVSNPAVLKIVRRAKGEQP
jgi:transposase